MNQNLIALALLLFEMALAAYLTWKLMYEISNFQAYTKKSIGLWLVSTILLAIFASGMAYFLVDTYKRYSLPYKEGTMVVPTTGFVSEGNLTWLITWDKFGTINVTEVDWGELEPGESVNKTIYIRNAEQYISITANISDLNWIPTHAEQYFNLTWDFENKGSLLPQRQREVVLLLDVSPQINNVTTFSFDIVITGWKVSS